MAPVPAASYKLNYDKDVFVSYTPEDQAWVKKTLLPRLEAAGLSVLIDYRDFEVGRPRLSNVERAVELLNLFFHLLDTCDDFNSRLALLLLDTVVGYIDWLEQIQPGARQQIKMRLIHAVSQELLYRLTIFWVLAQPADRQKSGHRSALEFWRDLCDEEEERRLVDIQLVQLMDLAAHGALVVGNYDDAEAWSRFAAHIAQTRLGDAEASATMLSRAEHVVRQRAIQPLNPAVEQALAAEPPSSAEYVEAMDQLNIRDSLQVMLTRGLHEQQRERFLPPLNEFVTEYATATDTLTKLLTDSRLLVDNDAIESRVSHYGNQGIASVIPQIVIDQHGNVRGKLSMKERFIEQYIRESVGLVGSIFLVWQDTGQLTSAMILDIAQTSSEFTYDWRIFEEGIEQHFQHQYTSASHIVIPQFENIARAWARTRGIQTKRIKDGAESEMLLSDLFSTDSTPLRGAMNPGLFDLIHWYMIRSASSFNYRNKIAHGWITPEECNTGHLSAVTIWLTLRMINDKG